MSARPKTAIDLGGRRELFVDEFLVDRKRGVALRMHHPEPREIVLQHDRPWEGNGCGYHVIFRDEDLYRMYYKSWQIDLKPGDGSIRNPLVIAYAESRDGLTWRRPNLGLHSFNGSRRNNIVWAGRGAHDFNVFKDANPEADSASAYKALGSLVGSNGVRGLGAFRSADGIHWELMSDEPVITDGRFDSQNIGFWDAELGEYRAYYRDFRPHAGLPRAMRDVKTARSDDFVNWSPGEWLSYPGSPVQELYTNQVQPYARAPHLLVGFPARYVERPWSRAIEALPEPEERRRRAASRERYGAALTDTLFMASRDRRTFKRYDEAYMRPGLRPVDNWVYGDNYVGWPLVETRSSIAGAPDELSLYATERYFRGSFNRLRRYALRQDGFLSLRAPLKGGEFVTRPVRFRGTRLRLNYSTSAAGEVRVELQDAAGRPIEGYGLADATELIGDDLDQAVAWGRRKSVARLARQPIRLRFVLRDADLFAFRFA